MDFNEEDWDRPPRLESLMSGSRGASSRILGKMLADSGSYRQHSRGMKHAGPECGL